MNIVILTGRLVHDVEIVELENDKCKALITVAVQREFKNPKNDTYETDFIKATLWQGIARNVSMYCKRGDMINLRGRIVMDRHTCSDEKAFNYPEIIAERVTFLTSK